MIVMGIDPGYAIVGYGVLEYHRGKFRTLGYGAITTPADMPFDSRLEVIYDELTYLLHKYKPESMAVEQLFFTSNQKTVIAVGQARGVIVLAGKKAGVPIYEYTPLQVKQSVAGYGRAVKKQVMEMTRIMLGLEKVPKPDDTADALAIAICHAHSAGSLLNKEKLLQR